MALPEDPRRRTLPGSNPGSEGHTETMTHAAGFDSASQRRLVVRVVAGPDRGRFVLLGDASLVVGASESADLPLHDPGVSRRHLEIALVPGGVRVVDLKSKNGTLLLGARLDTALVSVGAELVLGRTTLRIDDADAVEDAPEADTLGPLGTHSTAMRRLFGALARVAPTDVAVLVEGEPDVGQLDVARAVHAASARAKGPLVVVSFASLKREEAAAALFGTDAQPGAFERAHGGTLILEDIDLAPAPVQTPLARTLETSVVASAARQKRVSVRVVATTARDVDGEVRAGRLLAELRDVVAARATVPPLRERTADLHDLARQLLVELGSPRLGGGDPRSPGADTWSDAELARLRTHRWPGNLAELKQVLARAVATGTLALDAAVATTATLRDERDKFEKEKLVELLRAHGDNVSAAARAAGVDRRHLHRLLKKHGLRGHE